MTKKIKSPSPAFRKKQLEKNSLKQGKDYTKYFLPFVLIVTAIVFINTLHNNFVNWDDDSFILNNPIIKHLNWINIKNIFLNFHGTEFPLTILSYSVEYKLFGLNPFSFHFINYILHLLNVLLVYIFIKRLTGKSWIAFITSLFFGIHPMHVETVAWISERKDLLYSFFFLLSLNSYCKYLFSENKSFNLLWSFLWFLLSLFSKPAAACLPFVLLLIYYYHNKKITKKAIISILPFVGLLILIGVYTIFLHNTFDTFNSSLLSFNFIDKLFLFSYATIYYLVMAIVPFKLCVIHFYPEKVGAMLPLIYYISLPVLLLLIWGIFKLKHLKHEIIFGLLFYFITIVMVLQIVPVGIAIVSERYSYIPYIGIFLILGHFFSYVNDKKNSFDFEIRSLVSLSIAVLIIFYLFTSFERGKVWKNGTALFTDVIKKYPEQSLGWRQRGNSFLLKKDYKSALFDFDRSIKLGCKEAGLYVNMGIAKENLGYAKEALSDYDTAIKINPNSSSFWFIRGALLYDKGELDKAISDFNNAIKLNPNYTEAYSNRGAVLLSMKKIDESLKDLNKAIELDSTYADAYYNRGIAKYFINDKTGAYNDWELANKLGDEKALTLLRKYCK